MGKAAALEVAPAQGPEATADDDLNLRVSALRRLGWAEHAEEFGYGVKEAVYYALF
jgi:hypothetical protein